MAFLIDLSPLSDAQCEHSLEYMHKSMADPPDADPWEPHPEPLLDESLWRFSSVGSEKLYRIMSVLLGYLRPAFALDKAFIPDAVAVIEAAHRLAGKSPRQYTVDDWLTLADWIVLKYLPQKFVGDAAEYIAVRAAIAGRIKAVAPDLVPGQHFDRLVPHTIAGLAVELNLLPQQVEMLRIAAARAGEAITAIGDATRRRIKQVVLAHLQDRVQGLKGATYGALEQQLFDEFSYLNRDWRRMAITEAGNMQTEAVIASLPLGSLVKRFEHYKGACEFCEKLNGKIFTVVDPGKPDKDGWKEVWSGKSNVGRSASPMKREDGKLVKRAPDELWWPAAGLQHPNCFINHQVPVYTQQGWKRIGNIRIGDMVLTHRGRFRPVNWILSNMRYSGPVHAFKTSFDGRNATWTPEVTPEHPFLAKSGWTTAGEILIGENLSALAKPCARCNRFFVNAKHAHVIYCCKACAPHSGKNQFDAIDQDAVASARRVTGEANSRRLKNMTVEGRRNLTAAARAALSKNGYAHLMLPSSRLKLGIAAAKFNYVPTETEVAIASDLEQLGLEPALQFRIQQIKPNSVGRKRYWFADIALPKLKIAIEIDGEPWHGRLSDGRDKARDEDLSLQGWTVLRFPSKEAKANPASVADQIARRAFNHAEEYIFDWLDVVEIQTRPVRNVPLYNFGVEEDESYITKGGIVVHNCRGGWLPEHVGPIRDTRTKDFVDQLMAKHGLVVKPRPAAAA